MKMEIPTSNLRRSSPRGSINPTPKGSQLTPSVKRAREDNTSPGDGRRGKKVNDNVICDDAPVEDVAGALKGGATFSEVLKSTENEDLQLAIATEPPRDFTGDDRLDFIDAMGEKICSQPENSFVPNYENTFCRGNYLIVTARDKFSFDWLLSNITSFEVWQGHTFTVIPVTEIPKLKKALLWLPGKKPIADEECLSRLNKMNPGSKCLTWKIFSRKDELHGSRFLIGIEEGILQSINLKPYWSTIRGQITVTDEVDRARNFKLRKRQRQRQQSEGERALQEPVQQQSSQNQATEAPKVVGNSGRSQRKTGNDSILSSSGSIAAEQTIACNSLQGRGPASKNGANQMNGGKNSVAREAKLVIKKRAGNVKDEKGKITKFLNKSKPKGFKEVSSAGTSCDLLSEDASSIINNDKDDTVNINNTDSNTVNINNTVSNTVNNTVNNNVNVNDASGILNSVNS